MNQHLSRRRKPNNRPNPIIIFIVVIVLLLASYKIYDRYSFTREKVNMEEYLGVSGSDIAIYIDNELQVKNTEDETEKYKALCEQNATYLPVSFVKSKLNKRFYYEDDTKKILYTLPDVTRSFGQQDIEQTANAPYLVLKDEPYILLSLVKEFTNIRFEEYLDSNHKRVFIYTKWDKEIEATVKNNEGARAKGGNKSPIVTNCRRGEVVKVLESMTKWSKIKTTDGYIGYVRNSRIGSEVEVIPTSDYKEQKREHNTYDEKVCIGFHQLFSRNYGRSLAENTKNAKSMNVIAPTWFCIKDNDGSIRSISEVDYSQEAHKLGYDIWATINNFDVKDVDEKVIFSDAKKRKKIIDTLMEEVDENYIDGINIDIESLPKEAAEDFTQFVRELSVACYNKKIKLSIDVYVPYQYNSQYDLAEYNFFCDYVIVMCYDEHFRGSDTAGSVSSFNFVKDGIDLTLKNVDKEKLVIALPFYTRLWKTTKNGKLSSSVLSSRSAYESTKKQNLEYSFDDVTKQNYGVKIDEDGTKIEIWMEDEISLTHKMEEIKKNDLAGTAAWKLTQQKDTFFDIINLNE